MKKESNHNDEHHCLDSCFLMLCDGVKEKLMTPVHVINIPACLEFTSIIKSRPDSVYLDCLSLLYVSRKDSF